MKSTIWNEKLPRYKFWTLDYLQLNLYICQWESK